MRNLGSRIEELEKPHSSRLTARERSCLDWYFDDLCEAANLRDVDVRKSSP
jgi:hypothetical protein